MNELNWFWIVLQLTVPPPVAVVAAIPLWRRDQPILGNVLGTVILFGTAVGFIFREHAELDLLVQRCLEAGVVCWPAPSPFTRYAIYAFVALAQVFALFWFSLFVEERLRRRSYAPEWR